MRGWALAALALGGLTAVLDAAPARRLPGPLVAAHRGGALLWPENSLLAFRSAVALGADFLEFDVHLSRDGEVVVIHDATLERTTTGSGLVRERTLAELMALRLRDVKGSPTGERMPTLDEVVALAVKGRRQLLLEIKADAAGRRYPGIEERVLAVLDRHGMVAATVIMAFEPETWRRVRTLRPDVRAGALYSPQSLEGLGWSLDRAVEEARRAGLDFIGLGQALATPEAVEAVRKTRILLGVWTVNDRDAMRRFIDEQVGIVITDRPDLAKELLGR